MKKLYVALLLLVGTSHLVSAQTAGQYYFKARNGAVLENMSGAIQIFGSMMDEQVSPSIPFFNFTFAGVTHNQFSVSEDGVVVLGNAKYSPYQYDNYFLQHPALWGQTPAYPILLPWGEDLETGANGSISYKILGAAPSRRLIIEFKVNTVEGDAVEFDKTFQVWLSEGYNQIHFVYGAITSKWNNNANIGIASSATDFLSVNCKTNTVSSKEFASNSDGLYPDVSSTLPVNGTAYVYGPNEIVEEPIAPATPVSATVSMSPEYPVAGHHKHTIYLGYGEQSVTLQAQALGGNPSAAGYTYQWSTSTEPSISAAAAVKVSPIKTTTYKVTITDGNGNSLDKFITVYIIDPRDGAKFKVCKLGKTTICISKEAVDVQLKEGALLGDCTVALNSPSGTASVVVQRQTLTASEVRAPGNGLSVYPNPSVGEFTVQIPEEMQQGTITVFDANGSMVAQQKAGQNQQSVYIAIQNKKPGVYLIKLTANGRVQTSKIIVR